MNDSRENFITAAVKPLAGDAESRLAARSLLDSLVVSTEPDACGKAVARWEATDGKKYPGLWPKALYLVVALASIFLFTHALRIVWSYHDEGIGVADGFSFHDFFNSYPPGIEDRIAKTLSPADRLVVFGDLSISSPSARMKARWDGDPGNIAYFAEYALDHQTEHGRLPADFLATAARMDPRNAWFTYVAAGEMATGAAKRKERSAAEKAAHKLLEWNIPDPVRLEKSLDLLRQAQNQDLHSDPRDALHRRQLQLLPQRNGTEVYHAIFHTIEKSAGVHHYAPRYLAEIIAAKAALAADAGDKDGWQELFDDTKFLLDRQLDAPVRSPATEVVTRFVASITIPALEDSARKLGMSGETAALAASVAKIHQEQDERVARKGLANPNTSRVSERGGRKASFLVGFLGDAVKESPVITEEDVKPGRMMDHETLAWTATHGLWALFLIGMTTCAVVPLREPRTLRLLATRLAKLATPSDIAVILCGGVLLPMAWFWIITRHTPLGGRDVSLTSNLLFQSSPADHLFLTFAQFGALGLLVFLVSGTITRMRMAKRLRAIGMPRGIWPGATAAFFTAAFIPLAGGAISAPDPMGAHMEYAAAACGGIALVLSLAMFSRSLLANPRHHLPNATIWRVMTPVCAFAALLAISAAPWFKAEALRWGSRNSLIRPGADGVSINTFEHGVALQMRKELREMLDYPASTFH